jgi:hypothetical protein
VAGRGGTWNNGSADTRQASDALRTIAGDVVQALALAREAAVGVVIKNRDAISRLAMALHMNSALDSTYISEELGEIEPGPPCLIRLVTAPDRSHANSRDLTWRNDGYIL